MISREYIKKLCEDFLSESGNYLIDVKVSPLNKIMVLIENDQHVAIGDCISLSRHIEKSLDREKEDFELEVSSPGIDQPFKSLRQFIKYLGKQVEVKLNNGIVREGTLLNADEEKIEIQPELNKKNKKHSQQHITQGESTILPMSDIKETRLKLIF